MRPSLCYGDAQLILRRCGRNTRGVCSLEGTGHPPHEEASHPPLRRSQRWLVCEEYLGAEAYLIEGGSRELVPLGLGLLVLLQLLKQPTIELHCLSEPSNGGCEPAGHRESGQGTPRLRAPRHNAVPSPAAPLWPVPPASWLRAPWPPRRLHASCVLLYAPPQAPQPTSQAPHLKLRVVPAGKAKCHLVRAAERGECEKRLRSLARHVVGRRRG